MEDPFFHLSEAKSPSKGPRFRAANIIAILTIISLTLSIITKIPILALLGVLGVVFLYNGKGTTRRNDHIQAAADFYSFVVVVLPSNSPGARTATGTASYMRDDILSAKIIREPISEAADPSKPCPTGIMFMLRSRMAGGSFSLVNRDPEEILQLRNKLREFWGIHVSDLGESASRMDDLIGRYLVNDTGSGMSTIKVTFYALSLFFFMTSATLFLVFGIFAPILLIYLLVLIVISSPIAYLYLRDKNAYDGIKAVTVEANGLNINFNRKGSKFFTWDTIKRLSTARVTFDTEGVVSNNGRISFKGDHWTYYIDSEMADTLVAAYEMATGEAPPVKKRWV